MRSRLRRRGHGGGAVLHGARRRPRGGRGPVLGVFAGAWTAEHAARIPDGARVILDLDPDGAGTKYRAQIEATLADRWRAGRLMVALTARCVGGAP